MRRECCGLWVTASLLGFVSKYLGKTEESIRRMSGEHQKDERNRLFVFTIQIANSTFSPPPAGNFSVLPLLPPLRLSLPAPHSSFTQHFRNLLCTRFYKGYKGGYGGICDLKVNIKTSQEGKHHVVLSVRSRGKGS